MTRINLLPWREIRRRQRDRQLLFAGAGSWALMALIVMYASLHMNTLIENQNRRNTYLKQEITTLDKQIKEIQELKRKKESLLARMDVIQRLQSDRTQIVHVFDDLVRKLPKGVYLTSLGKKKKTIIMKGIAQSNARVSALMRNLDSSDWFTNPTLNVISVSPKAGTLVSRFTLTVRQEVKDKKADKAKTATAKKPGAG